MLTSKFKNPQNSKAFVSDDFWLWPPIIFSFGVAFFISFQENFLSNSTQLLVLFFASVILAFLNRNSLRCLIFLSCTLFLAGGFYVIFYQKFCLNYTKITGKIYVDVVGKVESVKYFKNPVNAVEGSSLLISNPKMFKSEFKEKKIVKKKKKAKKKVKKTTKKKKSKIKKKTDQKSKKKSFKKKKIPFKSIEKNFVNLADYQEIDRKFLDISKNYQQVQWLKIKGREQFPNAPPKISINLVKNFNQVAVNDVIALRVMLQPARQKEFYDDFDFERDAIFKKIGAYGFALGEAKIIKKAEISNFNNWFLMLRSEIRARILQNLNGDEAAISLAFLVGEQNEISKELISKIRISGLAHLLSISGFHLSLAATIFFVSLRFLLSRSQYLALNFDLKKISVIAAVLASYFYLKIAGSPLPAQRAFIAVLLGGIAVFMSQKINAKRAVIFAALLLILVNPYVVFNLSFQLSFSAILVLICFYDAKKTGASQNNFQLIGNYFWQIVVVSFLIQIATAPFLIKSFYSFSTYGFLANILAVPLTAFWIMPLAFLALFLMPFGFEKLSLLAMGKGVFLIKKIAIFCANLNYSNFSNLNISNLAFVTSIIGLLLICLSYNHLRRFGFLVFAISFLGLFLIEKPVIAFAAKQNFFTIYDEKSGLIFSKKIRESKNRRAWIEKFLEKDFKYLEKFPLKDVSCDEKKCLIEKKSKILVLLKRSKISEICKNDFDVIVNLTSKYQLPDCIKIDKVRIDNLDFYKKGGYFFFEREEQFLIETSR